jgi:flavodoxin
MKKRIIIYFSRTGNSQFMAEKLAVELNCEIIFVKPWFNYVGILFLISLFKWRIPLRMQRPVDLAQYDSVIIMGPVWGGLLISPLRSLIDLCKKASKKFHFAITCETKESDRAGEYGFNHVFAQVDAYASNHVLEKAAFSTSLIIGYSEEARTVNSAKIKITDANYSEILKERLMDFAHRIQA